MRSLFTLAVILASLASAQSIPSFANYGGAYGIFADPASDSQINPARIGSSRSSVNLPLSISQSELIGGIQNRFVWQGATPVELAFGLNLSNDFTNNPYGDANFRFGFSVPGLQLESAELGGVVSASTGLEFYADGFAIGINQASQTDWYTFIQGRYGLGIGFATPDLDLVLRFGSVYLLEGRAGRSQPLTAQVGQQSLSLRVKNEELSLLLSFQNDLSARFNAGVGWQTRFDTTRVGVWGRVYSDADFWLGSNIETPLAEGFSFLGSWSLYRDNRDGFSLEPLRLALTYRNLPAELFFEVPLYFQGNFFRVVRLSAGLSW